jgi:8-oxo-dGTP diphosphatase
MSLPTLTTERLMLRPLRAADAPAVFRLVNDYGVAGNLARVPFPYKESVAESWIGSTHEQAARGDGFHLAITQRGEHDDTLIGCAGLTLNRSNAGEAELGYWIGAKFWGQGFAREAARALLDWGFSTRGLDRVVASALTDNAASQAVLRAVGFRQTGQDVQDFMSRNRAMPVLLFEMPKPRGEAKPLPTLLVVACALVDPDGRVLLAQRPPGKALAGLWEFPGGKPEQGETPEVALIRELREELAIDVTAACLAPLTFASHAYESFHLLMPLFVCRRWQGTMRAAEGQALAWVRPNRMAEYPMPPADRPLVAMLQEML